MRENKGHARCNACGIRYVIKNKNFDYLILMDGDGEDRPIELKKLINKILDDPNKSVVAKRIKRSEGLLFRFLYSMHKLITLVFTGKKITVHTLFNKGHSDGIYQPLGPGVWMSHGPVFRNKNVFADWQTVSVEENDWTKYHDFVNFKNKAKSKWAIPGQEYSDELINFVDTYIENWVGYCEETIFDLGFVMVSPIDALVISKNQKYEDTMYSYGITPHYVPWRHRTFWDCGLHCIITDLERDVLS